MADNSIAMRLLEAQSKPRATNDVALRLLERVGGQEALDRLGVGAQLGSGTIQVNAPPTLSPDESYNRYARPDVPLDVTTGVPFNQRLSMGLMRNDNDRLAYLQRHFQGANIERTDDGNLIIRNVRDDATGQAKDMLVDEQDFTLRDVADFTRAGMQLGAELGLLFAPGVGGVKLASKMGRAGRVLTEGAASGLGSAAGGAAADLMSRDAPDIVAHNIREGIGDFGQGVFMGGGLEAGAALRDAARGRLSGLFAPGQAELMGIDDINRMNRTAGTDIRPTIGQMAKGTDALDLESFLSRIPFIGRTFNQMMERQTEQVRKYQRALMNDEEVTPLADLGAQMADVVRAQVRQPQEAARLAEMGVVQQATDQLESAITRMSPSALALTPEVTADLTRYTAYARFNEFRKASDELYSVVGNPEIPLAGLKQRVAAIEDKLPKTEGTPKLQPLGEVLEEFEDEVAAFLVDAAGKPVVSEGGKKINRDLVTPALSKLLRGLNRLGDTIPLEQLRTVRNSVDNAIKEGRGLDGIETFQLKKVSRALTDTFEEGLSTLQAGGGLLGAQATALKRANAFYKENIPRFEDPFVARLLKEESTQPGFMGSFEIMNMVTQNPDRFRDLERFLKSSLTEGGKPIGRSSAKQFDLVRRGIMEDIFRRASSNPGKGRFVNADSIVTDLKRFPEELQATLLGADQRVVERNLELLQRLKPGYKKVPLEELQSFMRSTGNTQDSLSKLATAAKRERDMFENEVVKKLFRNEEPVELSNLFSTRQDYDQALNWLRGAKNDGDVAQFMALLGENPEVVKRVRANTVAEVLQEAAQKARPEEAGLRDATRIVKPEALIEVVRDPAQARRLRLILGNENYNMLNWWAGAQSVLGKKAGQTLVGSNTRLQILSNVAKLLRDVPDTARYVIYSRIFTNKTLQRLVQEGAMGPATDVSKISRALIASPPVLEGIEEEYGQSGAELIVGAIQSALNTSPEEADARLRAAP